MTEMHYFSRPNKFSKIATLEAFRSQSSLTFDLNHLMTLVA